MTREELIEALRAVPVHDPLREEAIVHLTRDTYRERLDRMVAPLLPAMWAACSSGMELKQLPASVTIMAVQCLAAIDAEVERKAGEP